uniref:USP domain-containing protein n=2 Tax=Rhodosorus marinus TaxID=101924 RepID=A0A7S2ZZD2_9RHOD|mmetsp:Transcript_37333/g.149012  ORF Transcript_37333/g.149012 Transcript_37333/m.149012 type:complete len:801 (+) Transcript_37333:749-3151(+)
MELPTDNDDDKIPFALQKVFYELQNGVTPVKTKRLTKSFGWDSSDAFTQQDLHELNRLLCSHLEEAMKKQNAKNKISELFEGKLVNFIQCVNIDYTSTRDEAFFDLNLTVQGNKTIYESFDRYLEVEMLDGDNKYRAEGYEELQDAKRGVKFSKLPPVLQLHLKRFEFDYVRGINVKINDRLEFPGELDLRDYVEKSSGNEVYSLHSVLVHVGDVHAGHYYVYIRPFAETNQWYKFDDETVTLVSEKEAIDENFGSPTPRKLSNAYMLQYVQQDKAKSLLKKVEAEDVPKALEERILLDAEEEENRRRERDDFHLFMDVAIVREESLLCHNGADLIPWDSAERLDRRLIRKSMLFRELAELVAGHLGLDSHQTLRVWRLCQRQNGTIRPDRLLTSDDEDVPLSKLCGLGSELQLLVQTVPKSEVEAMETDEVMQFFKVFAPKPVPVLACIGSLACNRSATMKHSIQQLAKLKSVPRELVLAVQADNITVFEEDTPQPVKPIDIEKTHDELELGTGDIIVIQLPPSVLLQSLPPSILEKRSTPLHGMREVETASDYFMYLRNRIHVEFRDLQKPAESGIMLELLKTDTYRQTRKALSHALGVGSNPDKIRLYPFDIVANGPRQDSLSLAQLNSRGDSLENMLEMDYRPGGYTTMESKIFWYEYIDYDLEEFENKEEVRITWRYDCGTYIQGASTGIPETKDKWMRTKVLSVLVPFHTSTYEDVTKEMKKKLGIPSEIPIRVVEVKSSYVCRIVPLSELVPHVVHLPSTGAQLDYELRAEPDVLDDVDRHHLGRYALSLFEF